MENETQGFIGGEMMREIKFRAWNKHLVKMEEDICINEYGEVIAFEYGEYVGSTDDIVMQFTGLKDKNGKEIYEGDIVSFKVFDGLTHVSGTTSVYFSEGSFRLNEHHPLVDYIKNGELEVIGNIYEHSHLLEGEIK